MFFSGCNLRCVFCQNHDIAHQRSGFDFTPEELGEWYVKLQDVGSVHNINLVTPEVNHLSYGTKVDLGALDETKV